MEIILYGRPITKKNSMRAFKSKGKSVILPSKAYMDYEVDCLRQITGKYRQNIGYGINLKVLYFMPTKGRVDLVNLLSATCDILTKAHVIEDDNSKIVVSHDGSRVCYDRENPRAEIYIERI